MYTVGAARMRGLSTLKLLPYLSQVPKEEKNTKKYCTLYFSTDMYCTMSCRYVTEQMCQAVRLISLVDTITI